MEHPILNKFWKIIIYAFLLLLVGYFYAVFLVKYLLFDNFIIWVDTNISFVFIGFMNLGLWYFVRFNKSKERNLFSLILKHISVSIVYSIIWLFLTWFILIFIVKNQEVFFDFLHKTFQIKFVLGMFLYFFIILFYNIVIILQRNKENIQQSNDLINLLQQEELNNLKSQINPHFLFNSLNSISALVYENADDAHEAIVKLSDYFRYSLTLSKNQFTKVKDELENIERYFEIEKIRFPNKMKINYHVEEKCMNFLIPVLILQPIAENAVKHGVYQNINKSEIDIFVSDNNDFYTITFSNNFDDSNNQKVGTSTGLANVSKRLRLIYKRNDLLFINKKNDVFEIKIDFPKKVEL